MITDRVTAAMKFKFFIVFILISYLFPKYRGLLFRKCSTIFDKLRKFNGLIITSGCFYNF